MTGHLQILDNGTHIEGDYMWNTWLRIAINRHKTHRCIVLRKLTYLPIETREDPDVLGKKWTAVRSLYNAGVDYVYAAAGMYTLVRVGIA